MRCRDQWSLVREGHESMIENASTYPQTIEAGGCLLNRGQKGHARHDQRKNEKCQGRFHVLPGQLLKA